jgi:hypothetical protein
MAAIEGYRAWACNAEDAEAYTDLEMDLETEAEGVLEEIWVALEKRLYSQNHCRKVNSAGLSSRSPTRPESPLYDLPPLYDDVIHDLPPEYSALPPLAQRHSTVYAVPTNQEKSQNRSSSLLKDRMLDVRIDFENITGVREHKKKKAAAAPAKKATPPPPPPPPPPPTGGDGGDDNADGGVGGGAGGAGDGNGDGGGDDWGDDWNVSGSKKDKKKKQQEEEEERLAKEEEERKAAEASAAKDLSWADADGGADDSWAGLTSGGKKKKGKVRTSLAWFKIWF